MKKLISLVVLLSLIFVPSITLAAPDFKGNREFLKNSKISDADKAVINSFIDTVQSETKDIKNSAEVAAKANPIIDKYIAETKLQGESLAILYLIKSVYGFYKPTENVAILSKALEISPDNKFLNNLIGMSQINVGDNNGAVKSFEKALKLDAVEDETKGFLTPSLYNNLALAESNLGNTKTAFYYCDKAIEIAPKKYHAYSMRASLYAQQGNYKFALEDAIKAKNLVIEDGAKDKFALQNLNFMIFNLKRELGIRY